MFTLFSRISQYSTANNPDAAYIIGGYYTQNLVAEFKNDQWTQLDDLNKGRSYHGSITVGAQTMIVGGYSGKWVIILPYYFGYQKFNFFLSLETEVWELENGNNKVITPTLTYYAYGNGLYAVDFNFCSNWSLFFLMLGNKFSIERRQNEFISDKVSKQPNLVVTAHLPAE